ncbi:hypothetical protein MPSEU_000802400 [Mayamaea pseudoterrestris]|nr:hypothetical protein MPSEU_000802400 [Mayamaea pseudoterrestris]
MTVITHPPPDPVEGSAEELIHAAHFGYGTDDEEDDNENGSQRSHESDDDKPKRKKPPGKWFLMCPRCWALLLGVILPLWSLIFVSFAFGYGLAVYESGPEFEQNDAILKNQALATFQSTTFANITQRLPTMCLEIYISNKTISQVANDRIVDILPSVPDDGSYEQGFVAPGPPSRAAQSGSLLTEYIRNHTNETLNFTELLTFLENCSASAEPYVRELVDGVTSTASRIHATSDLTFSWNRCPLKANSTLWNQTALEGALEDSVILKGASKAYRKSLLPASQNLQYKNDWNRDALTFYFDELNQIDLSAMNSSEAAQAKHDIFLRSVDQATGRAGCYPNSVASVWFWFTVMTTIGYGNAVPITWQGRTMFFTIGFLNILLFGAVAASAGYVLSSLANDFASRQGIPIESKPWISCIFWAVLLYLWMLVIAYVYQQWKYVRLGVDLSLSDAYWWSFVSLTTVGLGDLSLEPEALVASDLLTFPVMFLVGFSLFGSFIADLTTVLFKPFEGYSSLADVLKENGILQTEESIRAAKLAKRLESETMLTAAVTEDEPALPTISETLISDIWHQETLEENVTTSTLVSALDLGNLER